MHREDDWITRLSLNETEFKDKLQLEDFYWNDNKMIFTEVYHLKRGSCCNNNCLHCPYKKDPN